MNIEYIGNFNTRRIFLYFLYFTCIFREIIGVFTPEIILDRANYILNARGVNLKFIKFLAFEMRCVFIFDPRRVSKRNNDGQTLQRRKRKFIMKRKYHSRNVIKIEFLETKLFLLPFLFFLFPFLHLSFHFVLSLPRRNITTVVPLTKYSLIAYTNGFRILIEQNGTSLSIV